MHQLNNVTLFCIDDVQPVNAFGLLFDQTNKLQFGSAKLFTSIEALNRDINDPDKNKKYHKLLERAKESKTEINIITETPEIKSLNDYSKFIINKVHHYIDSDFAMCIQMDGYPLAPSKWDPQFLMYDYIGAPWTWAAPIAPGDCPEGRCVGNAGFSIRSKKLMEALSELNYNPENGDSVEDIYICREKGEELQNLGFKFAPVELASRFSIENQPWNGQFGFHGRLTMALSEKNLTNMVFNGPSAENNFTQTNLRDFRSITPRTKFSTSTFSTLSL